MSDSMRSEFSPQQRQEVPAANLSAAGDIVVSEAINKLPEGKGRLINNISAWRKGRLALVGLAAAPFIVGCGWGNIPNPFSHSREVSPTPVVATSTPEIPKPKVISVGGTVEPDPASRSAGETIKLLFPEGIINGKSPLIPKGDTLSISFNLKSATTIEQCNLSLSDLLGFQNNKFSAGMYTTNEGATADIAGAFRTFKSSAKFSISDVDQKIINKITLSCVRDSNGSLKVNLSLPNEKITHTDKYGTYSVNPAEEFVSRKAGLDIDRRGKLASETATTPIALAVENINIANSKGRLVAIADRFDITPPKTPEPTPTLTIIPTHSPIPTATRTLTPTPVPTKPREATQVPVESPRPTIQPTKAPTPKPKEEANKWTREWAANETVPVREWWDDMVAKGYISIDATARKYAGGEIDNFLERANLVPNPVKYYTKGYGFINNCKDELDKLVRQGQGHIQITPAAHVQIPGGVKNCQIYSNQQTQP